METINACIDEFYSLSPVYRKKKMLKQMIEEAVKIEQLMCTQKVNDEYKRCIDLLDLDHSKCVLVESCIGYQNAQSELINNPPKFGTV